MAFCPDCGVQLTNNKGPWCLECYTKKKDTKKEVNFRYDVIKGRIAESLIEELFITLGYNVFRYGMEYSIPGIIPILDQSSNNDVAIDIRRCLIL